MSLDIGIDGISIFNSATLQGWPIIGRINNVKFPVLFLIGFFIGPGKPLSFDTFLTPFCDEVDLIDSLSGILINDKRVPLKIRCFVCDSSARSYVTNTHHHNAIHGCHKCFQVSEFVDGARMYNCSIGVVRTDQSFFVDKIRRTT